MKIENSIVEYYIYIYIINLSISLSLILNTNEKVKYYIKKNTYKFII